MKRNIILFATALLALAGCTKDPWARMQGGDWNNDHKILEIKFVGQAGKAVIKETGEATGTIRVQIATNIVSDMTRVEIQTLDVSYQASSSAERGGTLDFTGSPVISVTSATGKTRVYTIEATEFTETLVGCYAITSTWIFGGTGGVYGGSSVFDAASSGYADFWNAEGYGPAAENDDYLEFTLDRITDDGNTTGKCIHWGGVDGKHWNCIMNGAKNLEGTSDLDLHKFYRKIPVGTSTWVRNYVDNTITFTDADGVSTDCALFDKGTYEIYNQTYEGNHGSYSITIENQALGFTIRNGVEDWTNIYTGYDKVAKKPMAYFVKISRVASVPEASKTEGSEGSTEIVPPAPPEPLEIAGSWKVRTLMVWGGAKNSITKDSAESKSWCWNNIGNELDNILTFTPSEEGAQEGKSVYGPGADGLYWDYIYKGSMNKKDAGVDVDCSDWYGWLPHSEMKYTIDGDTIVWKKGPFTLEVQVLGPGTYKYWDKSDLIIADGSMGLYMPLMEEPSDDLSYQWTDYDRFVNSPLTYVMVFDRQ